MSDHPPPLKTAQETGLDAWLRTTRSGQVSTLDEQTPTINPESITGDTAPVEDLGWKPHVSTNDARTSLGLNLDYETVGDSGIRIANRMGLQRFAKAWQLKGLVDNGTPSTAFPKEDQDLLEEYGKRRLHDAVMEFDASTYAIDHAPKSLFDAGLKVATEFGDSVVSMIPQGIYGIGAMFSGEVPKAINAAIGLEGIQAPTVGTYLGAWWDKIISGSDRPISDFYEKKVRGEDMLFGALPWGLRATFKGSAALGELAGLMGEGPISPIGKAFGAVEKLTRLEKGAAALAKWATAPEAGFFRKYAALAFKEAILPGARFGAWEGISNYVDPNTGERLDGAERLKHAMVAAAWMPAFAVFSAVGAKAAAAITGDGKVIRSAFADWVMKLPPRLQAEVGAAGEKGFAGAWSTFVRDSMPGVPANVSRRMLGAAVQSAIEAIGFTGTDPGLWHNVTGAIAGEPGSWSKITEEFATNFFVMSALRFGGSRSALSVRELERLHEEMQRGLETDQQRAQKAPEVPGAEQPVTEPAPHPEAAAQPTETPAPTPAPEGPKGEVPPPDRETFDQHEYGRLLDFVEQRAAGLGVREVLGGEPQPERDAYVAYAARLRNWLEGGREGPKPKFPGGKTPEDVSTFEKDILDRWSRAQDFRAKVDRGEAKPAAPKEAAPVGEKAAEPQAKVDTAEKDAIDRAVAYQRDADLAEAKLALEGIGGPTAEEGIKLVYDKKNPPRLVTYQDGKFWHRNLYGDKTSWKELPAKESLKLRDKAAPTEPIGEQLAVVDQIAKRALELADQMTPEQARFFGAAANLAAHVDRQTDPAVHAALSMAEQIVPSSWGPRHIDLWSQMALRGFSPEAQRLLLDHFQVTPAPPPETPRGKARRMGEARQKQEEQRKARAQQAEEAKQKTANPREMEGAPKAQAPSSKPEAQAEQAATPSESIKPTTPEEVIQNGSADLASLSDEMLQAQADLMGIDPTLPREKLIAEMKGESGAVNVRALAGITAAVISAVGLYGAGPEYAPWIGLGAATTALLPSLIRSLAIPGFERLRHMGNKALAEKVIPYFRTVADRIMHYEGKLASAVAKVRSMTNEAMTRKGLREATRMLQRVTWKDKEGNSWGVSDFVKYLDGWEKLSEDMPKDQQEILQAVKDVINQGGDLSTALGVMMLERSTGRTFTPKFNRARWIMPRVLSGDGIDILGAKGAEAWNVLRDAIMELNGFTMSETELKMSMLEPLPSFKRAAIEFTRVIPKMPDYIRVNGRELNILESRPFEYATSYQSRMARRLAHTEVWGQEALTPDGIKLGEGDETLGVSLTPNSTPEQVAARQALKEYVEGSPNRREALKAVVEAMRVQAGLSPSNDRRVLGFDVADESKARHFVRKIVLPLRAIDVASKLVTPVTQNLYEPAAGAAGTVFGTTPMHMEVGRLYSDAVFNYKKFDADYQRYLKIGGVVGDQTLRFGAFSRIRRTTHRFGDIARQIAFVSLANSKANHFADMALARRAESLLGQMKNKELSKAQRNRMDLALDLFNFTPAEKQKFLDGSFTEEIGHTFMRRAREHLLFVRGSETAGALQSNRAFRFLFPFTQWASGNLRFSTRILSEFARTFTKQGDAMTPEQRRTRRVALVKYAANKGLTVGVNVATYALWAYGLELYSAFQGADDKQTAKNFASKMAEIAATTELGLPVLAPMVYDRLRGGKSGMVDAVASSLWPVDVGKSVINAITDHKSLVEWMTSRAPFIRHAIDWAGDPELKAAITRRFQAIPPKDSGPSQKDYEEFSDRMQRFVKDVQRMGENPEESDRLAMQDALLDAVTANIERRSKEPIKGEVFANLRTSEQRKQAWASVESSLNLKRMVATLSREQKDYLIQQIGQRLYDRLEAYDKQIKGFVDWSKRMAERGR